MAGLTYDVIVVGGGPAGMMAAVCAAQDGARVLLLEKNDALGKKLLLTGHGRCNITNTQALEQLREKYFEQGKFLNSAFRQWTPQRVQDVFQLWGVPNHEEENGRIFPDSQKSKTVLDALVTELENQGVDIRCHAAVQTIYRDKQYWKVVSEEEIFLATAVVLACGGKAFPQTGSTGDGYIWATKMGHTVQPLVPALAPILIRREKDAQTNEGEVFPMTGVTLSDVALTLMVEDRKVAQSRGDLLFTHQGFSGPAAMRLSRALPEPEKKVLYQTGKVKIVWNLLPNLRQEELQEKLLQAMNAGPNRPIRKIVKEVCALPERVVDFVMGEEARELPCHEVTKGMRQGIVRRLLQFECVVDEPANWENAYVTRGGINLKEIDPKTMASKCQSGIFFAGEVMDVDGDSGGFNLQHAWASGAIAGHSSSTLSKIPQTTIDAQNIR